MATNYIVGALTPEEIGALKKATPEWGTALLLGANEIPLMKLVRKGKVGMRMSNVAVHVGSDVKRVKVREFRLTME